jgi:1,4-dihydroxy-2-naphthoate octaprenyltransferase
VKKKKKKMVILVLDVLNRLLRRTRLATRLGSSLSILVVMMMMMMVVVVVYLFSVVKRMRFWCDAVGCLRWDLNARLARFIDKKRKRKEWGIEEHKLIRFAGGIKVSFDIAVVALTGPGCL